MLEPEQSLHPLDGNNRQQRAAQNQPVETAQDSCDSVPETLYKPGCRHGVLLRMVLMFVAQTPDRPKGCDAMSTLSNLRRISVEAIYGHHHQRPLFGDHWSGHRGSPDIGTGLTGIGLRTVFGAGVVAARNPF